MQAVVQNEYVTVADYLAAEEASEVRHEYLGGLVYATAGETRAHSQVVGNLYYALRQHLQGGPGKLYMTDIRVNLRLRDDEYYYYPDLVVTCDPRDTHPRFVHYLKLIVEIMSPSTQRIDRREKFFAYTSIESLEEYALVAQESREVIVFRRAAGWRSEKLGGDGATLNLNSLKCSPALASIYEWI